MGLTREQITVIRERWQCIPGTTHARRDVMALLDAPEEAHVEIAELERENYILKEGEPL